MMFKQVFLLTLIVVIFIPNIQAQETDGDAPYLYYYSDDLLAFVIERADGTDSRVFGDGLMALTDNAHNIHVAGPGWSPSGEWFAWTGARVGNAGYGWSGYKPYILSLDGSRRLAILDHIENAMMLWSPHEDLLFVAGQYTEPLADAETEEDSPDGYFYTSFALIDPVDGAIIATTEESCLYSVTPSYSPLEIAWVLDGQYAVARYIEETQITFSIFDKEGNITERIVDLTYENRRRLYPSVSPEGLIAYYTDEALIVESLITGDRQTFEGDPGDDQEIRWNSSGQYGLLWGEHLWLLEPGEGKMHLLEEAFELSVSYFGDFQQIWSPGGRHALLATKDELYHLDAETAALTPLSINVSDSTIWCWRYDGRALIETQANKESIHYLYDYDLDAGSVTSIELERYLDFENQYFMSPDDRYVAYIHSGLVIYDIEANAYQSIRPDEDSFYSMPGGEVYWHEDGRWLLIHEDALVAGGGYMRHLGIVRVDGSMRRGLGFSWRPEPNTINWLPSQVDLDSLPRAIAKPLAAVPQTVLSGSRWWAYLDWSPDGCWLISSPSPSGTANVTLWNLETGEASTIFEDVDISDDEKIGWVEEGDSYVPQIVVRDELFNRGEPLYIVEVSPDGNLFIAVDANQLVVLDASTGEKIQELGRVFFWLALADFSFDGRWLATGGHVRIWDTRTWNVVAALPDTGSVVAFSPDGTRLAVGVSWDIQIWDVMMLLERASAENRSSTNSGIERRVGRNGTENPVKGSDSK